MKKTVNAQIAGSIGKMREILQEDFLTLNATRYQVSEDLSEDVCIVNCDIQESPGDRRVAISGSGVGLVDAFFDGLASRYKEEHPSIVSLRFSSFAVKGLMSEAHTDSGTDAQANVEIEVTNSYGDLFEFQAVSPSVTRATIEAVLDAVTFFINSERAYVRLLKSLHYHQESGRHDQVTHYTRLLTEMVHNTSYSAVIEKLKG